MKLTITFKIDPHSETNDKRFRALYDRASNVLQNRVDPSSLAGTPEITVDHSSQDPTIHVVLTGLDELPGPKRLEQVLDEIGCRTLVGELTANPTSDAMIQTLWDYRLSNENFGAIRWHIPPQPARSDEDNHTPSAAAGAGAGAGSGFGSGSSAGSTLEAARTHYPSVLRTEIYTIARHRAGLPLGAVERQPLTATPPHVSSLGSPAAGAGSGSGSGSGSGQTSVAPAVVPAPAVALAPVPPPVPAGPGHALLPAIALPLFAPLPVQSGYAVVHAGPLPGSLGPAPQLLPNLPAPGPGAGAAPQAQPPAPHGP